jgi:hypothetical protein
MNKISKTTDKIKTVRHTFPCVESVRRVPLSGGRAVTVWRDRTAEPIKSGYEDEDIVMSCIANSGEDLDMICQLAKLKGVKAVEINWPGGTGAIIRN